MNLFFLLMILLVPTALGLTLAVTGLRNDLRLRRGDPYLQRGPELVEDAASLGVLSVSASVRIGKTPRCRSQAAPHGSARSSTH